MSSPRWISLLLEPLLPALVRTARGPENAIVVGTVAAVTAMPMRRVRLLMRLLSPCGGLPLPCFPKVRRFRRFATSERVGGVVSVDVDEMVPRHPGERPSSPRCGRSPTFLGGAL